ncbi:phosphoribosylformylglycinamidine cyclo-ligase [Seinonella peptonophila]|uniref:Phosphoribosylformylglycinamidine cyclo-ligase n=1 Tax=Seinonella peptonophila TaxID=112248 RepID=A0A1M4ZH49_9BACL|nr:phosphoribosylformylglycinamidine cyclo-ligase [Seinonella peptonophila]SHF17364.1 phosphoribosylformylglycinamidine cyclo-ligase [Seinonella peptonophila]
MSDAYRAAGVDIDAGNEAVERMKAHVARTRRPGVLGELGGFGGLFALPTGYQEPVLVSATDGVGTKLKVAFALNQHSTIGIDCVAMCVNDLVVQGAQPLFFLDYLATGKLEPKQAEQIVKGIADGCVEAGCALVGGETAEMPGMYTNGEYDVAGFAVGIVERKQVLDGSQIKPGDVLIGLASNGLHSNGFSLARKVLLEDRGFTYAEPVPASNQLLGEALLTPTRIYVKTFLALQEQFQIKGGAHITGGGLVENLPRILPTGCAAEVREGAWEVSPIFQWIQHIGKISFEDMVRTFNMGIGMVLVVPVEEADEVCRAAEELGERATRIGQVVAGQQSQFAWAKRR